MANSYRIIAGMHRGKRLAFHDSEGLRPSLNRVRETLFNWLMNDIKDSVCLDLFAGSGALGFEALSRGAQYTTLVEKNPRVATMLNQQLNLLQANKGCVIQQNALNYLSHCPQPVDLVFLDPPFQDNLLIPCLNLLLKNQWLTKRAKVYVETGQALVLDENWHWLKHKMAGQVHYGLIARLDK